MRYFFRLRFPHPPRLLLVESGSRHLIEYVLPDLRRTFGNSVEIGLVTCYGGLPAGLPESAPVWRVTDYPGWPGLRRLWAELLARRYNVLAVLCTGEPIMTKWKWALAARLPAKILVINENADYFWLDRTNCGVIRHFVLFRAGLTGGGAVRILGRLVLFPFTVLYLLLYAAGVHLRRKVRA